MNKNKPKLTKNDKIWIVAGIFLAIIILYITLSKKDAILESILPTKTSQVEQIDENTDSVVYNNNLSIEDSFIQSNCPNESGTFYVSAEGTDMSDLNTGRGITPEQACWNDPECEMYLTTLNGDHKKVKNLQKNILLFCNSGNFPVGHEWYGNIKSNNRFNPKDKILVFPTTKIFQCSNLENKDSVTFLFNPINVRFLRIYPLSWTTDICLRFDVLKQGEIQDNYESSRSYSSVKSDNENNRQSRLGSNSFWKPETNSIGEWAQIDFSEKIPMNGIKIQGSKQNPQHCIKTFCIHLSNSGENWDQLKNIEDETTSDNPIEPSYSSPLG